jgi:Plant transposon protein
MKRILEVNAARGFPGMLGNIDCQHLIWHSCPMAWAGQFKGKEKKPTISLEAIADGELHIWHAFFGTPGSLNDINVMDRSDFIYSIQLGKFPPRFQYKLNGNIYNQPYYLANSIYPSWMLFVKTIRYSETNKEKAFSACQEGVRKDVERAFGVLVQRFAILKNPCRLHDRGAVSMVMKTCIILHNMIVEARRDGYKSQLFELQQSDAGKAIIEGIVWDWKGKSLYDSALSGASDLPAETWASHLMTRSKQIRDENAATERQRDLIEHVYNFV